MAIVLLILFHRCLVLGEVFSPASMLTRYHPWAGAFPFGQGNDLRSDDVFLFFPMFATHAAMVLDGWWPFWDLTKLAGSPAFWGGVNFGQILYPFSVFFLTRPIGDGLVWYAAFRLLAGGTGMYAFLRSMSTSHGAAILGAIAFMLNGAHIVWLSSAIPTVWVWLPWALFAAERLIRRPGLGSFALLGLVLGFQYLGAYVAQSFIFVVVWAGYCAVRLLQVGPAATWNPKAWLLRVAGLGAASAAGIAVGSAGIFPMLESLQGSALSQRVSGTAHYPLFNGITYFIPNFFGNPAHQTWIGPAGNYCEFVTYMGIVPMFLAGVGIVLARRNPLVLVFGILAAFCLLYQYDFLGSTRIGYLPGFRQTLTTRWSVALATAVAVLAAVGLDALIQHARRARWLWLAYAVGSSAAVAYATSVAWSVYAEKQRIPYQLDQLALFAANLLLFSGILAWFAWKPEARRPVVAATAALVALDLLGIGLSFNPSLPRAHFYPTTPGIRFLQEQSKDARILPYEQVMFGDIPGLYGLASITGYDVSGEKSFRRFLSEAGDRSLIPEQAVTANGYVEATTLQGVASVNEMKFNVDPRSPLVGRLGVKFFATGPEDHLGYETVLNQGHFDGVLDPLRADTPVVQTFSAPQPFDLLAVMAATYARHNKGTMEVALIRAIGSTAARPVTASTAAEPVTAHWRLEEFQDNQWKVLDLPVQQPGRFTLRITTSSTESSNAVTLYASSRDVLPSGTLTIGPKVHGDLALRLQRKGNDPPVAYAGKDMRIYSNPRFHGRAWFVPRARNVASEQDAYSIMRQDPESWRKQVLLLEPLPAGAEQGPANATGSTEVVEIRPDRLVVRKTGPAPGFVVAADRHDSHWQATVGGKPAPVLRGDVILRAVPVGAGPQEIVFTYRDSLRTGTFWMSLGSMAILAALGLFSLTRRGR